MCAALIAGCGSSTGLALARKFASRGLAVHGARRRPDSKDSNAIPGVCISAVDFRDFQAVEAFVAQVEDQSGPIELGVHTIGANVRFNVEDTTERVYKKTWELAALSALQFAKVLGPRMKARGHGTLIFTGATASTRGAPGFSAFAGAMHAKRALAQSLARELGSHGVHVVHTIIDGPIDTPFVRGIVGETAFDALKSKGGLIDPAAIAETYYALHMQPKSCWTHEIDLRPFCEKF